MSTAPTGHRIARAPGRVNLIGDHTDYTGGLVFPMAVDRWTEIRFQPAERVELTSADEPDPVSLPLRVDDPTSVSPHWGRYVAGVVSEMAPSHGIRGQVTTTIPIGGGMSSSHALEVAVALALGFEGTVVELAQLTQRAENRSSGVPTGIMDQFSIAGGVAGHALLMDCGALTIEPVPLPDDAEVVVMFIAHRTLVGSAYTDRVHECAAAEQQIGPLRSASSAEAASIDDPVVRKRAMHVVAENQRVLDFAAALRNGDLSAAGHLMVASHNSLRDLYETSTPVMDAAVQQLCATPGVWGARMTGGGFGGCVVALTQPGALTDGWVVHAVDGATIVEDDEAREAEGR
ncbi:MAG TPA: galactokinase [Acidimicrobiaceae bacterium]|nr:galactokinase [Acidimicrobiaceae bacterium]